MAVSCKLSWKCMVLALFLVSHSHSSAASKQAGARSSRATHKRIREGPRRVLLHLRHDNNEKKCSKRNDCEPTRAPTQFPSVSPTSTPTISSAPSRHPSNTPSVTPTDSLAPSSHPSTSQMPSDAPSSKPSMAPSRAPSSPPSVSQAPSVSIWSLEQDDVTGIYTSSCRDLPPNIFVNSLPVLEFSYYLYLTDVTLAEAKNIASTILEPKLQMALTREAMTCDYDQSSSGNNGSNGVPLVKLSSSTESDTVAENCLDVVLDVGQSCWIVNAQTTATMHSNQLTASEIITQFTFWLTSGMAKLAKEDDNEDNVILDLQFQGFTNVDLDGIEAASQQSVSDSTTLGSSTSALNESNIPVGESTTSVMGFAAIGIAGTVLMALLAVVVVRRRKRREAYLTHLEMVEDLKLDLADRVEMGPRAVLVVDDSDLNPIEDCFEPMKLEGADHNYRSCASPDCAACKHRTQPTFIATDFETEVVVDLKPAMYGSRQNAKQVDDT